MQDLQYINHEQKFLATYVCRLIHTLKSIAIFIILIQVLYDNSHYYILYYTNYFEVQIYFYQFIILQKYILLFHKQKLVHLQTPLLPHHNATQQQQLGFVHHQLFYMHLQTNQLYFHNQELFRRY